MVSAEQLERFWTLGISNLLEAGAESPAAARKEVELSLGEFLRAAGGLEELEEDATERLAGIRGSRPITSRVVSLA